MLPARLATTLVTALAALYLLLIGGAFLTGLVHPERTFIGYLLVAALGGVGWWRLGSTAAGLAVVAVIAVVGGTGIAALDSLYPRASLEVLVWLLPLAGLFGLGAACRTTAQRTALLDGLLLAAAAVAAVALAQALRWLPVAPAHFTEAGALRVAATLNHPNNLAAFVALMAPPAVGRALAARVAGQPRLVWLNAALAAALVLVSLLTWSRGGQVALLGGLVLMALLIGPRDGWRGWWRRHPRRAARQGAGVLLALGLGLGLFVLSPLGSRFRVSLEPVTRLSQSERWVTWRAALRMVAAEPWTGVGPGSFWLAYPRAKGAAGHGALFTHAHSWPLHVAAEAGLPTLLAWAALLLTTAAAGLAGLRRAAPAERRRLAGLLGGGAGFVAAGLLDYHLGAPALAALVWLLLGVLAGSRPTTVEPTGRAWWAVLPSLGVLVGGGLMLTWTHAQNASLQALGAWQRGDLAAAARQLDVAQRFDPGQRAYELMRADLLLAQGDEAAARRWLETLAASPVPLDSWYRHRLAELQPLPAARRTLAEAIAADPGEPVLRVEAGRLALAEGQPAAAAAHFRAALRLDADAVGALLGLGQVAADQGRRADARRWVDRAAQVADPRDRVPRFYSAYGRVDPAGQLPPERLEWLHPNRRHGAGRDRVN